MLHYQAAGRMERRDRRAVLVALTAAAAGGKAATDLFERLRD